MRDSSATSRSLIVVFFTQRHPQTKTNITERNDGLTDGTKSRSRWDLEVFKGFISSALQSLSFTATQRRTFHVGKLPPKIYLYRKIWPKKNMVDMTTDVKLPWMLTCLTGILTFSCCIGQSFSVTYTVLHWNIGSRLKSEFACLQSLSGRLLKLIYFVKCKRTLFEPNFKVRKRKKLQLSSVNVLHKTWN